MTRLALAFVLFAAPAVARADSSIQKEGPQLWHSKHELSAHLGYQLGFGQQVANAAGIKLTGEYAYRFHPIVWFDAQISQVFGSGPADGGCLQNPAASCYRGGWMTQVAAGVKIKLNAKTVPLVVELPMLIGVNGIYNRECGDNGASIPAFRTGAGVKYFIKQRVGLGANINVDGGPAFHDSTPCRGGGGYTDYYGSVDFMLGAEFIL